jgi:hypothetical protein
MARDKRFHLDEANRNKGFEALVALNDPAAALQGLGSRRWRASKCPSPVGD